MSKHLVFVSLWDTQLEELINFLKEHQYPEPDVAHLEMVLNKVRYENV